MKCSNNGKAVSEHQNSSLFKSALKAVVEAFAVADVPVIIWAETMHQFMLHCNSVSQRVQRLDFVFPFDHLASREHLDALLVCND